MRNLIPWDLRTDTYFSKSLISEAKASRRVSGRLTVLGAIVDLLKRIFALEPRSGQEVCRAEAG